MPLSFHSISHGNIAFGFFNIDTDLLLLERYFFFAEEFCQLLCQISRNKRDTEFLTDWDIYIIHDLESIGDLSGAIRGTDYRGFIGEVYRLFPFPHDRDQFHQRPWGHENREKIVEILSRYAQKISIEFRILPQTHIMNPASMPIVSIGEYLFTKDVFHQLIKYIYLGGYPRWLNNTRPEYVNTMKKELESSTYFIFRGIDFTDSSSIPGYHNE